MHELVSSDAVAETVGKAIPRDFTIVEGAREGQYPCVMHRTVDGRDLYAVYNVASGALCRFRAVGAISLLDPYTGTSRPLEAVSVGGGSTVIRMPLEATEVHLIMFDPEGEAVIASADNEEPMEAMRLDDGWTFT